MNDDRDDPFLLANAYLDDELTAEERTRAESDAEVMTQVAALRALQAGVRAVTPPSDPARDSAIAAAMTAFAERPARTRDTVDPLGAVTTPPGHASRAEPDRAAPPTPLRPRRPLGRLVLAAAAAVVGVLAAGTIISRIGRSDDDRSAIEADLGESTQEFSTSRAEPGASEAESAIADSGDAGAAAAEDAELTAEASAEQSSRLTADAADAPTVAMAESSADASSGDERFDEAAGSGTTAGNDSAAESVIVVGSPVPDPATAPDPDVLVDRAIVLLDQRDRGVLPPMSDTHCTFGDDRPDATFLGEETFVTEVGPTGLLVGVDELAGTVLAVDPGQCTIVLEVPGP